jgi:hypothetical protein
MKSHPPQVAVRKNAAYARRQCSDLATDATASAQGAIGEKETIFVQESIVRVTLMKSRTNTPSYLSFYLGNSDKQ